MVPQERPLAEGTTQPEEAKVAREYDVIIIGSGPNGLEIGAYLARAGQKVLLVERQPES